LEGILKDEGIKEVKKGGKKGVRGRRGAGFPIGVENNTKPFGLEQNSLGSGIIVA
jgi:NADH:ubiquinone oxidoreductase subunit F (NADH-binding)